MSKLFFLSPLSLVSAWHAQNLYLSAINPPPAFSTAIDWKSSNYEIFVLQPLLPPPVLTLFGDLVTPSLVMQRASSRVRSHSGFGLIRVFLAGTSPRRERACSRKHHHWRHQPSTAYSAATQTPCSQPRAARLGAAPPSSQCPNSIQTHHPAAANHQVGWTARRSVQDPRPPVTRGISRDSAAHRASRHRPWGNDEWHCAECFPVPGARQVLFAFAGYLRPT